jgi:hypothetical protein
MQAEVTLPGRFDSPTGSPGDAELQTDVMRFFALLAICLIALMSLVREAPQEPTSAAKPAPESAPPAEVPARPAAPVPVLQKPTIDAPVAAPQHETPVLQKPPAPPAQKNVSAATSFVRPSAEATAEPPRAAIAAKPPAAKPPAASPPPRASPTTPAEPDAPLELRFASPEALMRLEARHEVAVFALAGGTGYRWSGDSRRFASHRLPETLYLMDPATVPAALRSALIRAAGATQDATWGVTLSSAIRARLDRRLADGARGLLLIDAAGNVAPEKDAP